MISFEGEKGYDKFFEEAEPLILSHWNEVGSHREILPFNPQHSVYRFLETAGRLFMLVARDEGRIIGYFFVIIAPHPRSITKTIANDDIVYASPEYRDQLLGYRLTKEALKFSRERAHVVNF